MQSLVSVGLQIDILVVNCSLFNPTPSLSAMIINHFKMRSNIVSYNLAGMGCSAGVIAINLAKEQLQVQCGHILQCLYVRMIVYYMSVVHVVVGVCTFYCL